jgi:hypothetical protein
MSFSAHIHTIVGLFNGKSNDQDLITITSAPISSDPSNLQSEGDLALDQETQSFNKVDICNSQGIIENPPVVPHIPQGNILQRPSHPSLAFPVQTQEV